MKIFNNDSQLIIVDVQKVFLDYIPQKIVHGILEYSKNFENVLYIYDVLNSDIVDFSNHDMPDSFFEYDHVHAFDKYQKEYAFFRNWMDTGVDEEDIINVAKYMIENGVNDSRDIDFEELDLELNTDIDYLQGDDCIYIPDVVSDLEHVVKDRPILVGGGHDECLREIYLLLQAMDKGPEINNNLTY